MRFHRGNPSTVVAFSVEVFGMYCDFRIDGTQIPLYIPAMSHCYPLKTRHPVSRLNTGYWSQARHRFGGQGPAGGLYDRFTTLTVDPQLPCSSATTWVRTTFV